MITVLLILFAHFVSDFIFQTDKQAINKSTSLNYLTRHVLTYSIGLSVFIFLDQGFTHNVWSWIMVNFALHWITDFFTSKLTSYLWKKEKRHWFFVAIGFDQLIHYTCLLLTYEFHFL